MRVPRALTIRTRILLFQLVVGVAVAAMFLAGLIAIRNFNYYLERGALAHRQLDLVTALARDADRYSETMAGVLATGAEEPTGIARLQSRLASGFSALEQATVEEGDFLLRHGADEEDKAELNRASGMRGLYDDMNRTFEALLVMRESGEPDAAIRVLYREIDSGIDDALETLMAEAVADEMAEIERADGEAKEVARVLGVLVGVTAAIVLAGAGVAGYFLYRSMVHPIRRLTAGAVAIGRGDLSFRVGALGDDEFGLLARRFDEMAGELSAQRSQLVAARSHLEAQVKARTAELEIANDALTDLDRSRVRFLADISHELRTPLTIMRGEAEVTLRGKSRKLATHRETLQRIVDQAEEMGRLVEDILLLARTEASEIRFRKEALDLKEIAMEAAREAEVLGRARGVGIELLVRDVPAVEGDRQRMKQILMIVLDNAVKYSTPGSAVRLGVRAEAGMALVAVQNRGAQVHTDELPRMFDRFYRGRDAASGGSAGSGLGLAIARFMVEKQGGVIELCSAEPDGVEVTLRFPVLEATARLAPPALKLPTPA